MDSIWYQLKQHTQARIGLGHAGAAIPTQALIDFQLAHAQARDAILTEWDIDPLIDKLEQLKIPYLIVDTLAKDRGEYIRRPDLGRQLTDKSIQSLQETNPAEAGITLILSNGLSSQAIHQHGFSLLVNLIDQLSNQHIPLNPVILVPNARVAVSDAIGFHLKSILSLLVIGERPGLSAADSLGIYLTYDPAPGKSDADRNCISNIRLPHGLGYIEAATKTRYLSERALSLGYSGVHLKDEMPSSIESSSQTSHVISPG